MSNWFERAACLGVDTEKFYRAGKSLSDMNDTVECLDLCNSCPVRAECLTDILAFEAPGARYGIFGGLTPDERRVYASTGRLPTREIKTCKTCRRRFITDSHLPGSNKYCTARCAENAPKPGLGERSCAYCNEPYRPRFTNQRFCSRQCNSLGRRLKARPCRNCGAPHTRKRVQYCSAECQQDYKTWQRFVKRRGKTCRYCETDWDESWECQQYCTRECQRLRRAEKQTAGPRLMPRQCPVCGLLYQGARSQKACSPKCLELQVLTS